MLQAATPTMPAPYRCTLGGWSSLAGRTTQNAPQREHTTKAARLTEMITVVVEAPWLAVVPTRTLSSRARCGMTTPCKRTVNGLRATPPRTSGGASSRSVTHPPLCPSSLLVAVRRGVDMLQASLGSDPAVLLNIAGNWIDLKVAVILALNLNPEDIVTISYKDNGLVLVLGTAEHYADSLDFCPESTPLLLIWDRLPAQPPSKDDPSFAADHDLRNNQLVWADHDYPEEMRQLKEARKAKLEFWYTDKGANLTLQHARKSHTIPVLSSIVYLLSMHLCCLCAGFQCLHELGLNFGLAGQLQSVAALLPTH